MCDCAAIPFILMKFLFRKTTVYISVVVIVVPVQVQSHKNKKKPKLAQLLRLEHKIESGDLSF